MPNTPTPLPHKLIGPMVVASLAVAMLAITWGTWPDPIIDFGRELYMPWQICQGKVLYRDILYFNGPLSPYLNALWFGLFGVSIRTLVWCNLGIAALIALLIYRLIDIISDRATATVACVTFVGIFAFGHSSEIANYNFVCPYSHELTHGMLLSLAAIYCGWRYLRHGRAAWVICGRRLTGLVFLTKPEMFLAAFSANLLALGLAPDRAAQRRWPRGKQISPVRRVGRRRRLFCRAGSPYANAGRPGAVECGWRMEVGGRSTTDATQLLSPA